VIYDQSSAIISKNRSIGKESSSSSSKSLLTAVRVNIAKRSCNESTKKTTTERYFLSSNPILLLLNRNIKNQTLHNREKSNLCGTNLDEGNKERSKTREKINYGRKSSKTQPVVTQDSPTVLNTDASDLSENGSSNKWERKSESESESEREIYNEDDDLSIGTLNPKNALGEIQPVRCYFEDYSFPQLISFLKKTFPVDDSTGLVYTISDSRMLYIRKVIYHLELSKSVFTDSAVVQVIQSWLEKIRQGSSWAKKIKNEILRTKEGRNKR
jgi:hypothetical protein